MSTEEDQYEARQAESSTVKTGAVKKGKSKKHKLPSMWTCSHCGSSNQTGALCTLCGTKKPKARKPRDPATNSAYTSGSKRPK